jgi:hypothetical protein
MIMKWYGFKYTVLWLILIFPLTASAQNSYEKRMEKRQQRWNQLIPTHSQLQYAGGMGLLSGGVGWDYGKNRWETDVFLGFLPRYSTRETKWTFTLKQNYIPWNIDAGKNFSFSPLSCGLYANTIFDEDFWMSDPDKYPNRYYSFSTKLRFHIYVGQGVAYNIPYEKRRLLNAVTFFYEISSSDLYFISVFGNSWLKPKDYLHLSVGMKFDFADKRQGR